MKASVQADAVRSGPGSSDYVILHSASWVEPAVLKQGVQCWHLLMRGTMRRKLLYWFLVPFLFWLIMEINKTQTDPWHQSLGDLDCVCCLLLKASWKWKWKKVLVTQLCPALLQVPLSMDILQTRMLEWVAVSSSRGSSRPRGQTCVSCIGRQILPCLSHQGSPALWEFWSRVGL